MPLPAFPPNIRLATPDDLPRLGLVATAGYYNAQIFAFRRPYFSDYPNDTVANYSAGYRGEFLKPRSAVFVLEDDLNLDERDHVCDELRALWPKHGQDDVGSRVIVAACSVAVPEECEWSKARGEEGKFVPVFGLVYRSYVNGDITREDRLNTDLFHQSRTLQSQKLFVSDVMKIHEVVRLMGI